LKIFYICESSIEHDVGGGGEGTRKAYRSLKAYCQQNGVELGVISLNDRLPESLPFDPVKTRTLDALARLCGHSNYLWFFWLRHKEEILSLKPDIVVLGRSRYGFMAKDIKADLSDCKVVTLFENVEIDYAPSYFTNISGLPKALSVALERIAVKKDERDCVRHSDAYVLLSERDKIRIREIYCCRGGNCAIIPVCLENATQLSGKPLLPVDLGKPSTSRKVVFTGRLCYAPNIESVEWLLANIIPKFRGREDVKFIIAGSRPSEHLKKKIREHKNAALVENFLKSYDIIPRCSLAVCPSFSGAGMKVKVADALSMGLVTVASDEALAGYEEAYGLRGLIRANTVDEYITAINDYMAMNEHELSEIEAENKAAFERYYSYERAEKSYARLLEKLV
jgi:glycosyltransferase involved in cell wall biosynthesis